MVSILLYCSAAQIKLSEMISERFSQAHWLRAMINEISDEKNYMIEIELQNVK